MLKRTTIALLAILVLTMTTVAQTPPPFLDKNAAHIRAQVEDLGVGHRITVKMKNGDYYHGAVSKIGSDSFEIAEVDLAQVVKFQYAEIKSLYGNYGQKNVFGKRPNPKTGAIVAAGVLGGLFAVILLSIPKT
jgi:hypothetical protein